VKIRARGHDLKSCASSEAQDRYAGTPAPAATTPICPCPLRPISCRPRTARISLALG